MSLPFLLASTVSLAHETVRSILFLDASLLLYHMTISANNLVAFSFFKQAAGGLAEFYTRQIAASDSPDYMTCSRSSRNTSTSLNVRRGNTPPLQLASLMVSNLASSSIRSSGDRGGARYASDSQIYALQMETYALFMT
jgi:hypothetical protein